MATESQIVKVRLEDRAAGQVAYVTVDNVEQRNRLGKSGKDELIAAFTKLASNENLRVAVYRRGDKSFIPARIARSTAGPEASACRAQDPFGASHRQCRFRCLRHHG